MKKLSIFLIVAMCFGIAAAELKTGVASFDPISATSASKVMSVEGEVLQIGVTSGSTNAFSLVLSDAATGTVIYSKTNITSTAFKLVPMLAATGTDGVALTNTLGTIYVPANVVKLNVTAGSSATTNDTLTVTAVVNKSP